MSKVNYCTVCGTVLIDGKCVVCACLNTAAVREERYDIMPDHVVLGMIADELCNLKERLSLIHLPGEEGRDDVDNVASLIERAATNLYRTSVEASEMAASQLYVHTRPR